MSKTVKTDIIPINPQFAKIDEPHELNHEAICVFAAIGFFLDQDTYWKDDIVLRPASVHELDNKNTLLGSKPWFEWHHTPRAISFEQALEEFTSLFETIVKEQTQGKRVILPLSGGLDSRTQAAALKHMNAEVFSYSYQFKNGYAETNIAAQIAEVCDFKFKAFDIPEGYLWGSVDSLFKLNNGFSDFTTPRQMALYHQYASMGDVFSLGHWGDVLFDSMNLPSLTDVEATEVILKKILKRGGLDFASKLWESWELEGRFETYIKERILYLLKQIAIEDTNAKLRAFKSLYWAPRWTSVNLSIFSSQKSIALPYYDQRMCEFICTIPETYLKDRQLQIAYIKLRNPELAKIRWQDQRPFNLHNYPYNKAPYNVPYRVYDKLSRTFQQVLGKPYVQRNWELQFLGKANKQQLEHFLFNNKLETLVAESLIQETYQAFNENDALLNAHAINILLVLSKFNENKGMAKRIKILYTIPNFDTAGSGKVVYDLVKGLDRTQFEVEICCFHDRGAFFKRIETLEVPIHLFEFASPYKPLFTLPFRVFKIARFFRKHQFDIIHSWHWSSDFTEPLAAKLAGIPFVYTKKAMGWGNRAWRWRSQLSTQIITINSDMLAFFESMKEKISPMPLGIDTNYFKPLEKSFSTPEGLRFSKEDFIIVTVANLAPVKGIEVLLEAVRLLNDPRVKVVHVGADESDYGRMLKSEYGQDIGVYFLGKQLDVRPYLAVCDVFVIPTKNEGRKEGLPIAPIEAMASSRIVIGSKVSGIKDILRPFQDQLFHPGDVTDLQATLVRMMSLNKEEQFELQHQMRQHIMDAYQIQDFIKNHESLYKGLVK